MIGCPECDDQFWDRGPGDKCPTCDGRLIEFGDIKIEPDEETLRECAKIDAAGKMFP